MSTLEMCVIYGEPTEAEIQKALETWTAYKLGLTRISAVRQLKPAALHEAKILYAASNQ